MPHSRKIVSLLILVIASVFTAKAQKLDITWEQLSNVTFTQEYSDAVGSFINIPSFSPTVETLDGKMVEISGYIIPVDIPNGLYVLSANPFANCFFCGNAGPETVIELVFKKKSKRFNTDDFIRLRGKMSLNAKDIYKLNYILSDVEIID